MNTPILLVLLATRIIILVASNLDIDKSEQQLNGPETAYTYGESVSGVEVSNRRIKRSLLLARQPKITKVEQGAPARVLGSISMPEGSPWCSGMPTFWLVGHQEPEHPWCRQPGGEWTNSSKSVLDYYDELNSIDTPDKPIDRHDCIHMDVNKDGIEDIICVIGTDHGAGYGYTELYLTRSDGTLSKVKTHGLQKYPTLRTRVAAKLMHASGSTLLFIGNTGQERGDGQTIDNRMFRHLPSGVAPYFEELDGPYVKTIGVLAAHVADVNNDGLDDFIITPRKTNDRPHMYVQKSDGTFEEVEIPNNDSVGRWRAVRVGHVTKSELPDLVTVSGVFAEKAYLRIFKGIKEEPYFDFSNPYYVKKLKYAAPDVEILDVNKDGYKDLYISQADETKGYCAARGREVWKYFPGEVLPDSNWVPPVDEALDILMLGHRAKKRTKRPFKISRISSPGNGCGSWLYRFGNDQSLIVAKGREVHAGYNYIYEWAT